MSHRAGAGERVVIGLSGGVDSAVAAQRLLEQGYRVQALFMKNWEEDDAPGYCAAAQDLGDAAAVAERLGLELRTVNFAAEYWDRVFQHFLDEYRALRTPNPDVLCNREIKFRAFLDHALGLGADWIATGHYARVTRDSAGSHLRLSADLDKDQTYFLHLLDQPQLARTLFPLSDVTKGEVRAIARRLGLPNAAKRDSAGICFIGERRFRDFLARYLPRETGPIVTRDGRVLGEHRGLAYYTIGQREGLGIGGVAGAGETPWFVAAKESSTNRLIVVQGHDHPLLLSRGLQALRPHWILGCPLGPMPFDCLARLRHRQPLQRCTITRLDDTECAVHFAEPQRAVAPGQAVVFYARDECLGGATIERAWPLDGG